jgi:branched-chain amino acid transport system permease protein
MATLVAILIDGLVNASWLFLVAVGLTLVCGVMRILNIAHGGLYAFGAYLAATLIAWWPAAKLTSLAAFGLMAVAALAAGAVLGVVLERGLLRFVYGRDEVVLVLITFAAFLILEDVITLIWGGTVIAAYQPYSLLGRTSVGRLTFSNYDLALVVIAAVVTLGLWWGLSRTRRGLLLRAVIHDREMAQSVGINVRLYTTVTFAIGCVFGALGGALTAPMISIQPGIGVEVIVIAFAIVVIGGMGSIPGALIGSLGVGLARAAAVHLMPALEVFVIYLVMTAVLAVRKEGLFAPAAVRRI